MYKKIVIIGASSLIAEHCARLLTANHSPQIFLIGRDNYKIKKIARDLSIRNSKCQVKVIIDSLINIKKIKQISAAINQEFKPDLVLIAHGFLPNQKRYEADIELINKSLSVNAASPVLWAESLVRSMEKRNHGVIGIISSVAGDRGRKSNYIYGASKGFISKYIQGMQHRLNESNVHIIDIKPGPTDTPMTSDLNVSPGRLSPVSETANTIIQGILKKKPVIYAPKKWRFIMFVIQHLPRNLFNLLDI